MKNRINYLAKKDICAIGGLIAPDEEFRAVEGESAIWISNYGRVISKRQKNARLIKSHFQNGYYRTTFVQVMYGKTVRHMYYLHVLVGKAFLHPAKWIKEDDKIEIHHIKRIAKDNKDKSLHYANNLVYVPRRLHKAIDSIEHIFVKHGKKWLEMGYDVASEYYDLSPYEFLNAFGNEKKHKPTSRKNGYQYYKIEIESENGRITPINIKIKRTYKG